MPPLTATSLPRGRTRGMHLHLQPNSTGTGAGRRGGCQKARVTRSKSLAKNSRPPPAHGVSPGQGESAGLREGHLTRGWGAGRGLDEGRSKEGRSREGRGEQGSQEPGAVQGWGGTSGGGSRPDAPRGGAGAPCGGTPTAARGSPRTHSKLKRGPSRARSWSARRCPREDGSDRPRHRALARAATPAPRPRP